MQTSLLLKLPDNAPLGQGSQTLSFAYLKKMRVSLLATSNAFKFCLSLQETVGAESGFKRVSRASAELEVDNSRDSSSTPISRDR